MKPTILTFVHYYLPGYKSGGPVRTIANMVEHLGDEFEFRIVTSDRDASDTEPYSEIQVDSWNSVGTAWVFYTSPRRRSVAGFSRLMKDTPHEVLYLNSFFDPVFTLRPLLARWLHRVPERPTVLAPRGEFSRGALGLKAVKKGSYLWLARSLGLYRAVTWHASTEQEAEDIRRALGRLARRITVAPDLPGRVELSAGEGLDVKRDGPLRVAFLSRITPMKNLDFALRVLARVRAPVEMNIYGIIDDQRYWRRCQDLIRCLPDHVTAHYRGIVRHEDVAAVLSQHELFFLPTRGENYGHAIHEALAAGLPVLISDQTPWRHLTERGVGWDLPLSTPEAFVSVLEEQAAVGDNERHRQRLRAREFGAEVAMDARVLAMNAELFAGLVGRR